MKKKSFVKSIPVLINQKENGSFHKVFVTDRIILIKSIAISPLQMGLPYHHIEMQTRGTEVFIPTHSCLEFEVIVFSFS